MPCVVAARVDMSPNVGGMTQRSQLKVFLRLGTTKSTNYYVGNTLGVIET